MLIFCKQEQGLTLHKLAEASHMDITSTSISKCESAKSAVKSEDTFALDRSGVDCSHRFVDLSPLVDLSPNSVDTMLKRMVLSTFSPDRKFLGSIAHDQMLKVNSEGV
ncbi:hypothetical protein RIF29_14466 [Crotalaria pallida]|uniref:Uncharacterized protein n=1 Tax=Crotalaria pallida TaxID=3830 RepID=A0AAN9FBC5_CROPI